MAKKTCDICEVEQDEHLMIPFFTGSRVVWLCWTCYKNAQREATKSDLQRQKKLYQIHQGKKRNR